MMARAIRRFEEGRTYHVYNRVGGGVMPFSDHWLSESFVEQLRVSTSRDKVLIFAWSLLGNRFHAVLRQGPVPLSRTMKTLQQGVTSGWLSHVPTLVCRKGNCPPKGDLWS